MAVFLLERKVKTTEYAIPVHSPEPQLYRYLNEEFADEFLTTGRLKLGSYKKYRAESHPEIGDIGEGRFEVSIHSNEFYSAEHLQIVDRAYILCLSTILSKEIQDKFNASSSIAISDINQFTLCIANNIPGCIKVLHGHCIYQNMPTKYFPQFRLTKPNSDEELLMYNNFLRSKFEDDLYFYKNLNYAPQHEYRLVFITDRETQNDFFIESKSAAKFCQKIKL